jgi:hypothetical protein
MKAKIFFSAMILFSIFAVTNSATFAQDKTVLIEKVVAASDPLRGELVQKFVTFNFSPQCWGKIVEDDSTPNGVSHVGAIGKAIQEHAKMLGYGDLDNAVTGVNIDRNLANAVINKLNGKFSYTINAKNIACAADQFRLLMAYSLQIVEFFGGNSASTLGVNRGWRPRAGKMFITLNLSPTAKDISVSISPDGANFTVTAPVNVEPSEWDRKIESGLAKGGK